MKRVIFFLGLSAACSACQEGNKSYDTLSGPENVLMAPLTTAENRQENKENEALFNKAVEDSAFYTKREKVETIADSATAPHDTAVSGKDLNAGVNMSADHLK